MILPTPRALALLAAVAPIGLLGFVNAVALDILFVADGVIVFLALLDGYLAPRREAITIARHAPESFSAGRSVKFHYRWQNASRRTAHLRVREVRPDLLGGVMTARNVVIPANGKMREAQTAVPDHRGRRTAGWFAIRSRGPLGVGQRQWKEQAPWSVVVYPAMPASRLKASIAAATRRREAGLRTVRRIGEGRQFESLREWVPGDDTRFIDWKATAKRKKLMARQFEEERRQQVMLVLDAGRLLTADVAGQSRMELAVRTSLWLAFAAHRHDDDIGVMVVSDTVTHYVTPQRGRRGLQQVLDVLATVEAKLVEPDYPAAFRYLAIRNRKRALTVFITDVIDRAASEALVLHVGSLRPRHLPLVVTLKNPELEGIADSRPDDVHGAYRKAAAEELLAARDEALGQMRRGGAVVLDVHPERASAALVEKYLDLKRRGRL